MKTIAITGATGSIGMALINKCISEKVRVLVFARPDSTRLARIPDNPLVKVISCDLAGLSSFNPENEHCDVFYHFAWAGTFGDSRNNMELQARNAEYALDAVRLAKRMGAKAFIGAGSQAEYGRVEGMLTADTPTNPENGYGIYKLEAGKRTRALAKELGIAHVWTRILSVYGPYDGKDTMIMATIVKLLRGECPPLTKGEQVWDYLYSEDAANAMFLLGCAAYDESKKQDYADAKNNADAVSYGDSKVESDKFKNVSGNIYVIGSGIGKPLSEYITVMRDAIDKTLPLGFGQVPYGPKQVMHLQADITKLKADTGFAPAVDFAEGIRRTIEYVKSTMQA